MKKKKVAVAMSGGVDSSVAAALLIEAGYDVLGLTMVNYALEDHDENNVLAARKAADILNISHEVVDLRSEFEERIIRYFCNEYSRGLTPNPCIRCNREIKFGLLMEKAREYGAGLFATGHYVRKNFNDQTKRFILNKAKNKAKDQSYFLYCLTQEQLKHALFPLGEMDKDKVRQTAVDLGLPAAHRPESQEICFIPDNDYVNFLKKNIPGSFKQGPILGPGKKQLGRHKGILHFTIGQRRGLGISSPHPLYVLELNARDNAVIVGEDKDLKERFLTASKLNLISLAKIDQPLSVKARIRYKHKEAEAVISPLDKNRVRVEFSEPQRAITPGQSVVFYDGDTVVGGAVIEQAGRFN
jgi:tRNA-uridine 2-sulfurtransferase